jgi:hypothetical protein
MTEAHEDAFSSGSSCTLPSFAGEGAIGVLGRLPPWPSQAVQEPEPLGEAHP